MNRKVGTAAACGALLIVFAIADSTGMAAAPQSNGDKSAIGAAGMSYAVAAIHRSPPTETSSSINEAGDTLSVRNASLLDMLAEAYEIRPELIKNLPSWATSEHYDITGKMEGVDANTIRSMTDAEHRTMLLKLLRDRFDLQAHQQSEIADVYILSTSEGNAKIQPTLPAEAGRPGNPKLNGVPEHTLTTHFSGTSAELVGNAVTLHQLAFVLGFVLNRSVVDETKLGGLYDVDLTWSPENGPERPEAATGASIFTALDEQLGLRLKSGRAPVEEIFVDSVARPSGN